MTSVSSNTKKDRGSENNIPSDSRNNLQQADSQQNDNQDQIPDSLSFYASTPNKIIPLDEVKGIIKDYGLKNLETKGNSFRVSKRKGGNLFKIPLRESHTFLGILNIAKKMEEVQSMTKEQLQAFNDQQSTSKRKKLATPFKEVVDKYNNFKHYEESTIEGYRDICTALKKAFGELLVNDLDQSTIRDTILATNYNFEGKKKLLRHLTHILELAVEEKIITAEQFMRINFAEIRRRAKQMDQVAVEKTFGLSEEEVNKVEALNEDQLREEGLFAISLAFKLSTRNHGPRPGELRANSINDVEISNHGQIKILHRRAATKKGYKTTKIPKGTPDSVDLFGVNEGLLHALVEDAKQYPSMEIEVNEKGRLLRRETVQFLLVNPTTQQPYTEDEYRDEIKRLQSLAGIKKPVSPRYLRHTFASIATESGYSEEFIFKQMTHCDDKTSRKHYIQVKHQDTRKELIKANQLAIDNLKKKNPSFLIKPLNVIKKIGRCFLPNTTRSLLENSIKQLI